MALISVGTQTSDGEMQYTEMNEIIDALKSAGYDINPLSLQIGGTTRINSSGDLTVAAATITGALTVSTSLTGVLRADSGVVATDSDVTDLVSAASDSLAGKVELATIAETNTGTDTGRAVTPDGIAGSYAGTKVAVWQIGSTGTDLATGDAQSLIQIPAALNGMDLVGVSAAVATAGTTGTMDVQIRNVTQAADMLSTKITIDSAETSTATAATPAVIDTANDDVATNDVLAIDIDAVQTTAAQGPLVVVGEFRLP